MFLNLLFNVYYINGLLVLLKGHMQRFFTKLMKKQFPAAYCSCNIKPSV